MMNTTTMLFALGLATAVAAQAPQLQISIGVRETGVSGPIGSDGGFSGAIEWVNRDGQSLTLDGTWQQFTFDLANDPITGFTGNGMIDGTHGTLEHVRVLNNQGITTPIQLWIDDVTDTTTTGGAVNFGDFENFANGTEVMFQEPDFSGSTSSNIVAGSSTGVDNFVASRTSSDRFEFQFVDNTATRWVRLTTFRAQNIPNPVIRLDDDSVITFWMRGGKCQPNLGSQGPGATIAELCGDGLGLGQQSSYYTAGAPAGAPGALAISLSGQADVPFLGGNLVSFAGFLFSAPVLADGNGRFSFPISGQSGIFDVTLQSGYADASTQFGVAFTNAVNAEFGR